MMNSKPLLLISALLFVLSCAGEEGNDVPGDPGGDISVDASDVIQELPPVEVDVLHPDIPLDSDVISDTVASETFDDAWTPDGAAGDVRTDVADVTDAGDTLEDINTSDHGSADVQTDVVDVTDTMDTLEDVGLADDGGVDVRTDADDVVDTCECVEDEDCQDIFLDLGACELVICTGCVCDVICDENCTTDTDQDGVRDCFDLCPLDPMKYLPGACGCGFEDVLVDSDDDGWWDCIDQCPGAETDADQDGHHAPCKDACDDDPARQTAACGGCSVPDTDADSDGVPWCNDACDNNFKIQTESQLPGCAAGSEDCLYYKALCTVFGDTRVTCHRYCNDDTSVPECTDCAAIPRHP